MAQRDRIALRAALVCAGVVALQRVTGLPDPPADLTIASLFHYYWANAPGLLLFAAGGWVALQVLLASWDQAATRLGARNDQVVRYAGGVLLVVALAWQVKLAVDAQEATDRIVCLERSVDAAERGAPTPACLRQRRETDAEHS